jgi:hypothetical protein
MDQPHPLYHYLSQVPDPRNPSGLRHPIGNVLLTAVCALASGVGGWKQMARFIGRHRGALTVLLDLRDGPPPSMHCVRRVLMALDPACLGRALALWSAGEPPGVVCLDGKAIRGTVRDAHGPGQDFACLVSAVGSHAGAVLAALPYFNRGGEAAAARQLVAALPASGSVLAADALHCSKKRLPQSWSPETTTC